MVPTSKKKLPLKYTLAQLGTQDTSHQFHLIAFGVMTGGECATETSIFLTLVQRYLKARNFDGLPSKWLVDGSSGFRDGIRRWHEEAYGNEPAPVLAMCYYHLVAAVRQKTDYLTKTQMGQALFDIELLSEQDPTGFAINWPAVKEDWTSRGEA